jgi:hypothetical protein
MMERLTAFFSLLASWDRRRGVSWTRMIVPLDAYRKLRCADLVAGVKKRRFEIGGAS